MMGCAVLVNLVEAAAPVAISKDFYVNVQTPELRKSARTSKFDMNPRTASGKAKTARAMYKKEARKMERRIQRIMLKSPARAARIKARYQARMGILERKVEKMEAKSALEAAKGKFGADSRTAKADAKKKFADAKRTFEAARKTSEFAKKTFDQATQRGKFVEDKL